MQGMNYLQKLKHGSAIVFKNILKHARLNNDGVLQIIPLYLINVVLLNWQRIFNDSWF